MISLVLERKWKKSTYTIGRFYVEGAYFGNSMEGKDRGMNKSWPLKTIELTKAHGRTAIPAGSYVVQLTHSPKFASRSWGKSYNGLVPEIMDVPGFSGIRIRPLSTADDSLADIGIGENKYKGRIVYATRYYRDLMSNYLVPAHIRGEAITITIR